MIVINTVIQLLNAAHKGLQVSDRTGKWHDEDFTEYKLSTIKQLCNDGRVRAKPSLTPVDLSVLIDSGIDCEFWNEGSQRVIGTLHGTSWLGVTSYASTNQGVFYYCKPRMNHWHSWQGGDYPLPDGVVVHFLTRANMKSTENAINLRWGWKTEHYEGGDIIAFKVTGLADGYRWPWE